MALEIKNQEIFNRVVSDAIQAAITNCKTEYLAKRWERAIDRAVEEIEENPYLDYDSEKKELLILSSSSNQIYSANGVCQCKAYLKGTPCWHRACARIWRLYLEAENKPLPPTKAAAAVAASATKYPENFLPITRETKREKIGNIRI